MMKIENNIDGVGFDRRMSKEEINACPMEHWSGPVSVIRTKEELSSAMTKLAGHTLLGFDTETRPAYKKGESYLPSLVQIASSEEAFIFQLNQLGFPQALQDILADSAVVKTGVSLDYDIRELAKLSPFKAAGFFDLGHYAKKVGIQNHGLRGLAAVCLGFRISKGAQTSNWAKTILTPQQIRYAATDAWVGRKIYMALQHSPAQELI